MALVGKGIFSLNSSKHPADDCIDQEIGNLKLLDWEPASQMVVKETAIMKPKFPVIDFHNHLGDHDMTEQYLENMNETGVWKVVSLDGRSADDFYQDHLERLHGVSKRYDELGAHPQWSFYGDNFPGKDDILNQRNRVIERHPDTTFIATHMANLPEELGRVSMWLEKYPNMYVDINARISELGRQPYTARKFMIKYQDRILFATDTPPRLDAYRVYYRFLETDDEYIDSTPSHHRQGRWMIYGIFLPDDVLEKIYNKNSLKILAQFKGS